VNDVLKQALSSSLATLQIEAGFIALVGVDGLASSLRISAERGLPPEVRSRLLDGQQRASILEHTHRQREGVDRSR
jgi:hypothetical protein